VKTLLSGLDKVAIRPAVIVRSHHLVNEVVVALAQGSQVVEVEGAVMVPPPADVVDAAAGDTHGAAGERVAAMHRSDCDALVGGGGADSSPLVEHGTVAPEHDGDDVRIAACVRFPASPSFDATNSRAA
jgi:hypothetical protein